MALDQRALDYATKRIEEFALVQQGRDTRDQIEAVNILLPSLGFDDDLKERFHDWLLTFVGGDYSGQIMLGLLVGLFMHQYETEGE